MLSNNKQVPFQMTVPPHAQPDCSLSKLLLLAGYRSVEGQASISRIVQGTAAIQNDHIEFHTKSYIGFKLKDRVHILSRQSESTFSSYGGNHVRYVLLVEVLN